MPGIQESVAIPGEAQQERPSAVRRTRRRDHETTSRRPPAPLAHHRRRTAGTPAAHRAMAEAFGLDRKIENYKGTRPITLYRWGKRSRAEGDMRTVMPRSRRWQGQAARVEWQYHRTVTGRRPAAALARTMAGSVPSGGRIPHRFSPGKRPSFRAGHFRPIGGVKMCVNRSSGLR